MARISNICMVAVALLFGFPAHAAWIEGNITGTNTINNGSIDGVYVDINTSTGCAYNSFVLYSTDAYFEQIYAQVLTAQATGRLFRFYNVYCTGGGWARGNEYKIL